MNFPLRLVAALAATLAAAFAAHGLTLDLQTRDPAAHERLPGGPRRVPRVRGRFCAAVTRSPQKDRSNLGQELKVDRTTFQRGIRVHAPCGLTDELKPEYRRFVALAGADENRIAVSNGSNLAKYPSVVFKVFLDGLEAAASPVMRVQPPAWRFDVEIPAGAKTISLVAMDAGDGSREDFGDWVDPGFVVRERARTFAVPIPGVKRVSPTSPWRRTAARSRPARSAAPTARPSNQLLRIEQLLGKNAVYAGRTALPKER